MLAWQKTFASTQPVRNEVPVPVPADDSVLIKVLAAGVCHSDVTILNLTTRWPGWPSDVFTLGHEGCGEVVALGSSVTDLKVGDIVAVLPVAGCGLARCGQCSRGFPQICNEPECEKYGLGHDGSYAPYQAVRSRACALVPDGVSPEEGAVATDACLTAYHAVVETANLSKDETVVIYGLGGLGFNALQIAQSIGARVIVVDKRREVLDEAVKFGVSIEDTVAPDEGLLAYVKRTEVVIDTIIDFVGVSESFEASQTAVRRGGKLVQVGLLSSEMPLKNFVAVMKHLSILCSYSGTMKDLKACLNLIASGKLRPQVGKGGIKDLPKILEDLHAGKIKSRLTVAPNQE